jgi:hypothetical protein
LAPFGPAVSEEKIFLTLANQKQELPLAAIFVGGMGRNEETVPLVEQEQPTFPEFTPVFSGVCVTRSLVLCVCFVDH